jgi:hypothetical protein
VLSDFNLLIGSDVFERPIYSLQGVEWVQALYSWGKVNEQNANDACAVCIVNIKIPTGGMPISPSSWLTAPHKGCDHCGNRKRFPRADGGHLSNVSGFAFSLNVCVEAVNTSDSMK